MTTHYTAANSTNSLLNHHLNKYKYSSSINNPDSNANLPTSHTTITIKPAPSNNNLNRNRIPLSSAHSSSNPSWSDQAAPTHVESNLAKPLDSNNFNNSFNTSNFTHTLPMNNPPQPLTSTPHNLNTANNFPYTQSQSQSTPIAATRYNNPYFAHNSLNNNVNPINFSSENTAQPSTLTEELYGKLILLARLHQNASQQLQHQEIDLQHSNKEKSRLGSLVNSLQSENSALKSQLQQSHSTQQANLKQVSELTAQNESQRGTLVSIQRDLLNFHGNYNKIRAQYDQTQQLSQQQAIEIRKLNENVQNLSGQLQRKQEELNKLASIAAMIQNLSSQATTNAPARNVINNSLQF
jgi:hypothetical protein